MMRTSSEDTVNFGKSIVVPSVQELAKKSLTNIPPRYSRLDQDATIISGDGSSNLSVPVIDLECLNAGESINAELQRMNLACREWGFFQVVNHGISTILLEDFRLEIVNFFKLSYEEKKKLWQQPDNHEGFGQLFVVSEEQKLDWSDMFYITTLPLNLRRADLLDKLPPKLSKVKNESEAISFLCGETLETYSSEMKRLAIALLGHMARALKMDGKEMEELFTDGVQSMRMNYYPPCPEPGKAIGFTPHSDADALTILFQLNETEGLQIRKEGRWVSVKPLPNAFVVNIGDIMEIVSNGIYRSIEHRSMVNATKERLSIATFYSSKLDSMLGPAASLIGPHNLPIFRQVPLEKYFKEFFAQKLNGKSYLDFMRVANAENNI